MNYEDIIKQMTLDDKVALCSGVDFWRTKAYERYGIPSIMVCDGPHGLRKQEQEGDPMGINDSKASTCFPAACATGSSWDIDLVREIGEAIAMEALQEDIAVVLGPGINIKRNPLCGRNFEYFSEDPYLTGELAVAFIQGVEGQGVGTSLKHFAANSQENKRISSDSIVDERTLREIYLSAFEAAIRKGKPATVMGAYNKINGTHCSDNKYLLKDILRDQWGFSGVVITDWGAMSNRIAAFEAGTDLEMPGGTNFFDNEVIEAVKSGRLSEERIDESVDRLLTLIFKTASIKGNGYSPDSHHLLARRAASNSAVLLKNQDNLLPLNKTKKIAVIGSFAKKIRYQGSGSSHINPTHLTNVIEALDAQQLNYCFYKGCNEDGTTNQVLLKEAVDGAKASEIAVVFAGLTESYESEGFDRESLSMPDGHIEMIEAVARANPNTVVVLMGGSVFTMPWFKEVKAVLHMYLPGQAGGEAIVDLLYGDVNPSGKLAETYPISYFDVASSGFYEEGGKQAQYREGIYVGYRYYDKAGMEVSFPFGYGLSYTDFQYSDMRIYRNEEVIEVTVSIKNTGRMAGAEVVQLYISDLQEGVHKPQKELKGFNKVFLQVGEEKRITFYLDKGAFAYYDITSRDWQIQRGNYNIMIAATSRDIRLSEIITLEGTTTPSVEDHLTGTWYHHLQGKPQLKDFEALLGTCVDKPPLPKKGSYTLEHSISDMQESFLMRLIYKIMERTIGKRYGGVDYNNPTFKMIMISVIDVPMKNLCILSSGKMKRNVAEGLVYMANGKFIKGIKGFVFRT